MNESQFAASLRAHLAWHDDADPHVGHGLDLKDLLGMGADALRERHRAAHMQGEWVAPEHNRPADLHWWMYGHSLATPGDTPDVEALRRHLLTVHHNDAALTLSAVEAKGQHRHEHQGPGGVRNHVEPGELHRWMEVADTQVLPAVPAPAEAPASSDAPAPGADGPVYEGGAPVNLAAVIQRVSALDGDLTELGQTVVRDLGRVMDRMEALEVATQASLGRQRQILDGLAARQQDIDTRVAPASPTLDRRAVLQAQALMAEIAVALGTIDGSHWNHGRWPEPGSERSITAQRLLHRALGILDGLADSPPPTEPCNCAGGVNATSGSAVVHAPGCNRYAGPGTGPDPYPGYRAVYAYLDGLPEELPANRAQLNGVIWGGVWEALNALGYNQGNWRPAPGFAPRRNP